MSSEISKNHEDDIIENKPSLFESLKSSLSVLVKKVSKMVQVIVLSSLISTTLSACNENLDGLEVQTEEEISVSFSPSKKKIWINYYTNITPIRIPSKDVTVDARYLYIDAVDQEVDKNNNVITKSVEVVFEVVKGGKNYKIFLNGTIPNREIYGYKLIMGGTIEKTQFRRGIKQEGIAPNVATPRNLN